MTGTRPPSSLHLDNGLYIYTQNIVTVFSLQQHDPHLYFLLVCRMWCFVTKSIVAASKTPPSPRASTTACPTVATPTTPLSPSPNSVAWKETSSEIWCNIPCSFTSRCCNSNISNNTPNRRPQYRGLWVLWAVGSRCRRRLDLSRTRLQRRQTALVLRRGELLLILVVGDRLNPRHRVLEGNNR